MRRSARILQNKETESKSAYKRFINFANTMADGYLENKMAEHRATAMRPAGATRKRNALDCGMPEKRVAVIGSPSPLTASLLKIYSESGCRVALLTDCETHELCALYSGIRIISTGVTSRCMPLKQSGTEGVCPVCGKKCKTDIYWGVAY